jgi:hypothetical protein
MRYRFSLLLLFFSFSFGLCEQVVVQKKTYNIDSRVLQHIFELVYDNPDVEPVALYGEYRKMPIKKTDGFSSRTVFLRYVSDVIMPLMKGFKKSVTDLEELQKKVRDTQLLARINVELKKVQNNEYYTQKGVADFQKEVDQIRTESEKQPVAVKKNKSNKDVSTRGKGVIDEDLQQSFTKLIQNIALSVIAPYKFILGPNVSRSVLPVSFLKDGAPHPSIVAEYVPQNEQAKLLQGILDIQHNLTSLRDELQREIQELILIPQLKKVFTDIKNDKLAASILYIFKPYVSDFDTFLKQNQYYFSIILIDIKAKAGIKKVVVGKKDATTSKQSALMFNQIKKELAGAKNWEKMLKIIMNLRINPSCFLTDDDFFALAKFPKTLVAYTGQYFNPQAATMGFKVSWKNALMWQLQGYTYLEGPGKKQVCASVTNTFVPQSTTQTKYKTSVVIPALYGLLEIVGSKHPAPKKSAVAKKKPIQKKEEQLSTQQKALMEKMYATNKDLRDITGGNVVVAPTKLKEPVKSEAIRSFPNILRNHFIGKEKANWGTRLQTAIQDFRMFFRYPTVFYPTKRYAALKANVPIKEKAALQNFERTTLSYCSSTGLFLTYVDFALLKYANQPLAIRNADDIIPIVFSEHLFTEKQFTDLFDKEDLDEAKKMALYNELTFVRDKVQRKQYTLCNYVVGRGKDNFLKDAKTAINNNEIQVAIENFHKYFCVSDAQFTTGVVTNWQRKKTIQFKKEEIQAEVKALEAEEKSKQHVSGKPALPPPPPPPPPMGPPGPPPPLDMSGKKGIEKSVMHISYNEFLDILAGKKDESKFLFAQANRDAVQKYFIEKYNQIIFDLAHLFVKRAFYALVSTVEQMHDGFEIEGLYKETSDIDVEEQRAKVCECLSEYIEPLFTLVKNIEVDVTLDADSILKTSVRNFDSRNFMGNVSAISQKLIEEIKKTSNFADENKIKTDFVDPIITYLKEQRDNFTSSSEIKIDLKKIAQSVITPA